MSSQPQAQKGHPTLIFDRPITDLALWRECLAAFHHAYPRLDPAIKNPVATVYNGSGCEVVCINGLESVCPFEMFEHCILAPYRAHVAAKEVAFSAESHRVLDSADIDPNRANRYVEVAIEKLLHEVATAPAGRRHITLRDKSKRIGHLLSAEWHTVRVPNVVDLLMHSISVNGYLQSHGKGQIRQTIQSGLLLGAKSPAPMPMMGPRAGLMLASCA